MTALYAANRTRGSVTALYCHEKTLLPVCYNKLYIFYMFAGRFAHISGDTGLLKRLSHEFIKIPMHIMQCITGSVLVLQKILEQKKIKFLIHILVHDNYKSKFRQDQYAA
jgi:hypothetical protein